MADDQSNLLAALMGQQAQAAPQQGNPFYYPGSESIYGTVGSTIASALPSLVSPTASVGQNLGVTLGGALIASLLGYKARQETNEAGLLTARLASQMMEAPTSEARQAILESAPTGFMAPNVQGRLLKFEGALVDQQMKQRAAQQQALAGLQSKAAFAISPLGQALNDLETKQAVERAGQVATAQQEAMFKRQERVAQITQDARKTLEEFRSKLRQTTKEEDRKAAYEDFLKRQQVIYDYKTQQAFDELTRPSKEMIDRTIKANATVAEIEDIAEQWKALNGGKGYSGAQVKLGIQNTATDIGKLYARTVGLFGRLNELQGMSKQMSDLDRVGLEGSIFGNFMGITGAIPSNVIGENILAQIPAAARRTPDEFINTWGEIVGKGLRDTAANKQYFNVTVGNQTQRQIAHLEKAAENVANDETLTPPEKFKQITQMEAEISKLKAQLGR